GPDLLRRDVGDRHRVGDHRPDGARHRAGGRDGPAGVPVAARGEHHPQLLRRRHRPERGPDPGQLAGDHRDPDTPAGHPAAGHLAYDPTSATPVCLVALNSKTQDESTLYDTGRYQVRVMIMASRGANAPVVFGGKLRTILAYLDRDRMQARGLSPTDVMHALDKFNVFIPAGDAKIGDLNYSHDQNAMYVAGEATANAPRQTDAEGPAIRRNDGPKPKDGAL